MLIMEHLNSAPSAMHIIDSMEDKDHVYFVLELCGCVCICSPPLHASPLSLAISWTFRLFYLSLSLFICLPLFVIPLYPSCLLLLPFSYICLYPRPCASLTQWRTSTTSTLSSSCAGVCVCVGVSALSLRMCVCRCEHLSSFLLLSLVHEAYNTTAPRVQTSRFFRG